MEANTWSGVGCVAARRVRWNTIWPRCYTHTYSIDINTYASSIHTITDSYHTIADPHQRTYKYPQTYYNTASIYRGNKVPDGNTRI